MNLSRAALSLVCSVALLGSISGCKREARRSKEFTPPNPNAPALYGLMTNAMPSQVAMARTIEPFPAAWTSAPLAVLQTELSPVTLIHSASKHLSLFAGLTNVGLSAPSHIAWSKIEGPRSFKQGEKLDVARMQEGWVLVWWADAAAWTNYWDSPWVVYLQHQPKSMKLDADGLHFEFPGEAGDVVLMPLYGYEKAPPPGKDERAAHGLTKRKVPLKTWDWAQGLTRDPLTRLRYWASVTRELPIRCEESFSVDRAHDAVTIRSRFERHSIRDDWNTPPLKLAPISPTLLLAVKSGAFPARFSRAWFDLEMPTPCGPLAAIEGVDEFDVTLSVLQYVNETDAVPATDTNAHPSVLPAWEKLREEAGAAEAVGGDADVCRMLSNVRWLAKALPFLDPLARSNAVVSLGRFFRDEMLVTNRLERHAPIQDPGREHWLLKCPDSRDRGNALLTESLWAYAHFSGDWELVRERWPLVKGLFFAQQGLRWACFGAAAPAALGDQAAQAAAFARLAWQAGDLAAYDEACGVFARELARVCVKQRGAEHFRKLQPWHTMEFMDDEVFVTQLDGATGWQFDGPKFPAQANKREFHQRWERFNDVDVSRYLREWFASDLRREMNWLQRRWPEQQRRLNTPHALPSLIQLRSLLLNESPAELAKEAAPDQFTGPSAGKVASCLAILRASSPVRYQRLIPPGPPTSFTTEGGRDVAGPKPALIASVNWEKHGADGNSANSLGWPELTWPAWRTPTGAPWSFGQIRVARTASPQKVRELPLNSNTRIILFD